MFTVHRLFPVPELLFCSSPVSLFTSWLLCVLLFIRISMCLCCFPVSVSAPHLRLVISFISFIAYLVFTCLVQPIVWALPVKSLVYLSPGVSLVLDCTLFHGTLPCFFPCILGCQYKRKVKTVCVKSHLWWSACGSSTLASVTVVESVSIFSFLFPGSAETPQCVRGHRGPQRGPLLLLLFSRQSV